MDPDATSTNVAAIRAARSDPRKQAAPGRVELLLPDGAMALAETLANLDAMLTVLWAHRQFVAARQTAAEGKAATAPAPDFVLRRDRPAQNPDQPQ
jgi:hypothetical protein